jgi:hypothetical protein
MSSLLRKKKIFFAVVVAAAVLAAGMAWGRPEKYKGSQVSAMRAKFSSAQARQPIFCTNCAKLDVRLCSIPGYGCPSCNDIKDYLGVVAFLDPDLWIVNEGNLASNPGTVSLQWYDLREKTSRNVTIPLPAVPPGGSDAVTFVTAGMLFLAGEGVTMTLDYSDSAGTRHKVRKITKCPDN